MSNEEIAIMVAVLGLAGTGTGVWVKMRERIVRSETKIENLENQHRDHKSDFTQLREWLETQFDGLRREISRKADRDK